MTKEKWTEHTVPGRHIALTRLHCHDACAISARVGLAGKGVSWSGERVRPAQRARLAGHVTGGSFKSPFVSTLRYDFPSLAAWAEALIARDEGPAHSMHRAHITLVYASPLHPAQGHLPTMTLPQ